MIVSPLGFTNTPIAQTAMGAVPHLASTQTTPQTDLVSLRFGNTKKVAPVVVIEDRGELAAVAKAWATEVFPDTPIKSYPGVFQSLQDKENPFRGKPEPKAVVLDEMPGNHAYASSNMMDLVPVLKRKPDLIPHILSFSTDHSGNPIQKKVQGYFNPGEPGKKSPKAYFEESRTYFLKRGYKEEIHPIYAKSYRTQKHNLARASQYYKQMTEQQHYRYKALLLQLIHLANVLANPRRLAEMRENQYFEKFKGWSVESLRQFSDGESTHARSSFLNSVETGWEELSHPETFDLERFSQLKDQRYFSDLSLEQLNAYFGLEGSPEAFTKPFKDDYELLEAVKTDFVQRLRAVGEATPAAT